MAGWLCICHISFEVLRQCLMSSQQGADGPTGASAQHAGTSVCCLLCRHIWHTIMDGVHLLDCGSGSVMSPSMHACIASVQHCATLHKGQPCSLVFKQPDGRAHHDVSTVRTFTVIDRAPSAGCLVPPRSAFANGDRQLSALELSIIARTQVMCTSGSTLCMHRFAQPVT